MSVLHITKLEEILKPKLSTFQIYSGGILDLYINDTLKINSDIQK